MVRASLMRLLMGPSSETLPPPHPTQWLGIAQEEVRILSALAAGLDVPLYCSAGPAEIPWIIHARGSQPQVRYLLICCVPTTAALLRSA